MSTLGADLAPDRYAGPYPCSGVRRGRGRRPCRLRTGRYRATVFVAQQLLQEVDTLLPGARIDDAVEQPGRFEVGDVEHLPRFVGQGKRSHKTGVQIAGRWRLLGRKFGWRKVGVGPVGSVPIRRLSGQRRKSRS
jgi:hypothetical protein